MTIDKLNESLNIAREKASKLNLQIKIIEAKRDNDTLTFFFEAESRVDFRQLVVELNTFFKEQIRLEQIGPRDVVKKIGAVGPCGKETCCKKTTSIYFRRNWSSLFVFF